MPVDPALTKLRDTMPLTVMLGIEIVEATSELVRAELAWAPELCTVAGGMHGGALMTLADSSGAVCAFLNLPDGYATSTIESKTNFMRGVREGVVTATSRPVHVGRTTIVVETDVVDADARMVSKTIQTQAVIAPRP
jgi:1,4-dihydroxy-2-naphthoyl-CoA hydrolase